MRRGGTTVQRDRQAADTTSRPRQPATSPARRCRRSSPARRSGSFVAGRRFAGQPLRVAAGQGPADGATPPPRRPTKRCRSCATYGWEPERECCSLASRPSRSRRRSRVTYANALARASVSRQPVRLQLRRRPTPPARSDRAGRGAAGARCSPPATACRRRRGVQLVNNLSARRRRCATCSSSSPSTGRQDFERWTARCACAAC